jgi:hypothetical protein
VLLGSNRVRNAAPHRIHRRVRHVYTPYISSLRLKSLLEPASSINTTQAQSGRISLCGGWLDCGKRGNLPKLFWGSGNKLTSVEGLTKCARLKELSLCNNELTSVRGLPKLAELDVRLPSPPLALVCIWIELALCHHRSQLLTTRPSYAARDSRFSPAHRRRSVPAAHRAQNDFWILLRHRCCGWTATTSRAWMG